MALYIYPPTPVSVSVPPLQFLLDGVATDVSRDTATPGNSDPLPVINLDGSGNVATPLTDAQLRASPVPVSGPLTDTQLRASAVPVSAASLPLPTGAATESTLSGLNAKFGSLGQKNMAGSAPVVIASDQSAIPVTSSTVTLEVTGSAAALNADAIALTNVSSYRGAFVQVEGTYTGTLTFQGTNDGTTFYNVLAQVVNSPTTAASSALVGGTGLLWVPLNYKSFRLRMTAYTSGTATATAVFCGEAPADLGQRSVSATQSGAWNITNITGTVSLPTGAATAANQVYGATNIATLDFSSTPVTSAAYVTLLGATSAAVRKVQIFMSQGNPLILATGAAASEVDRIYVIPGGNGLIDLTITTATRVSLKALSTSATEGIILVNFFG